MPCFRKLWPKGPNVLRSRMHHCGTKENMILPSDRKKRKTYPYYHEDVQAIKEGRQHLDSSMRHLNAEYASDGLPI